MKKGMMKKISMNRDSANKTNANKANPEKTFMRRISVTMAAVMLLGLTACGNALKDSGLMEMTGVPMAVSNGSASASYDTASAAGAYDEYYTAEAATENGFGAVSDSVGMSGGGSAVDNSAYFDSRKLIRTVDLEVETKEFDSMLAAVEEQVNLLGGYIENMNTYNGSRYSYGGGNRNSSLTARIPKDKLNEFLYIVSESGNIIRRSENVQDVTLTYVDLESRKESLETEQERLQELLSRAESMEDILIIEDRMSTVRYQLESMGSQLRTYDNQVEFSTVYMDIREVRELTPVEEESAWDRMAGGFMDSVENVKDGFVNFCVWIVVHVPYLLIWAAVICAIVVTVRLLIRRGRRKKEAKLRKMTPADTQTAPEGIKTEK